MGSKASKPKRPTPTKPKTIIIPIIPHDIINEILDNLATDSDFRSIRACALVSKSWVEPCQFHLFHTVLFVPWNVYKWLELFRVRERSPAHHVRDLHVRIGAGEALPDRIYEHLSWFTNVDRIEFSGGGGYPLGSRWDLLAREPSLWKLSTSVTSLTINTNVVTLVHVRDIMAQMPNLDDLGLLGPFAETDRRKLPGIGTVLKGRFGGRLMLRDADEDVVNMLLEIPSGLHFVELEIYCTHSRLPPWAVRFTEACGKTLVKLSHTASYNYMDCRDIFERSFDFSKLPNVQEVTMGFVDDLRGGGLPWIPMALSTIRPTTSPCVSVIRLNFRSYSSVLVENLIADMRNDLRWIADEVARIAREFEGTMNFSVILDSQFGAVVDTLNILRNHTH